jgi:glycosyltransferase involved in cell wall biosynthesis
MENKFISVLLCNYNYGILISETIQSVLDQDYDNYEFIIVDDGSSDNSREIISEFANNNPDKIRTIFKENEGQAEGFNVAASLARGCIVCLLDSDDIWLPEKLSMVNRWFNDKDDIALLQHNMKIMRNATKTEELFREALIIGDIKNHTRQTKQLPLFIPTSGLSFSRTVLDKVLPIPKAFKTCADGYLTRTSMCYGKVYAELDAYGYYRLHAENSVFGNERHNVAEYVNDLLIPHLTNFYQKKNIDIRFPKIRFLHRTYEQIKRIPSSKPHVRLLCSPAFEKIRNRLAQAGILIDPSDRALKKLKGQYTGRSCHVLGRGFDSSSEKLEDLRDDFVFIADTNALHPHIKALKRGMYCLSDLRFWEQKIGISPNMEKFLCDIKHLYKVFELPARARSAELPFFESDSYVFKTVDRDYAVWKGFVTEDCTKRLMWGYHVVLDMCIPLAFYMGFKKIFLHGCSWDRIRESESLAKFFSLMCGSNNYNLSENFLPYDTPYGQTELLWKKSYEILKYHYEKLGLEIECLDKDFTTDISSTITDECKPLCD